ncbi:P-loop containing nucleoside triphosphate hydrolase protein [Chytridium lagenaria]|nr:P-loop containing nucleoside triphosphate hydrolase protein [Chytridium lagenaria]
MPPKSSKTMNTTTTTTINPASYRVDSIAKFVEIQKILVKREMGLQRRGVALLGLGVTAMRTGLGGSTLLDLEPTQPTSTFPPNRFKVGDIVTLEVGGKKTDEVVATGVVARMRDAVMTVAVKEDVPDAVVNGGGRFRVTQMGNEVTYKSVDGMRDPTFESTDSTFTAFDVNLNPSQIEAVKMTLCASDVALIHGPPGTGKTQTVVEVIPTACGERGAGACVWTVEHSCRLSKCRLDIARIGHPARVKKEVLGSCLGSEDVRTDLDRAHLTVQKAKGRGKASAKPTPKSKPYATKYYLSFPPQSRTNGRVHHHSKRPGRAVNIERAASMKLKHEMFDTVVIDEEVKLLKRNVGSPLLKAKKVILAGDHKQLPRVFPSPSDLPSVNTTDETVAPLLLINTSEAGLMEDAEGDDEKDFGGESFVESPYGSADSIVEGVVEGGLPGLEIGTVDSFQGGEREAIILSLVRSNDKNEIGFLQDSRRLNVAITRARRHLCVIANVECMTRNPFLKGLFEYMEEHGDVEYAE